MGDDQHTNPPERATDAKQDFAAQAEQKAPGFLAELSAFLSEKKKWWLAPVLIVLLLVGVLLVLAGTGIAPFLYPFL